MVSKREKMDMNANEIRAVMEWEQINECESYEKLEQFHS